ncbi:ribosome small subunit-dependent GTPase A [Anaerovorax odorimutans]|uniref:Small ribosomal subunit biogenesis GTPase RsgA n=1 Tax=Anaerovorax odorimutans TaxID=109327 RepID=A0ABT1RJE6_9FIRM|nr:ribosome small subunit-dependent GTPase A [Anaerovorax odorimutans]MCQ4635296.1 ribosome small subunit-dependent GTPase A [Anaerovorax odorimutans]
MKGTIVKGIAGFYYVKSGTEVYQCKARGVFKKEGITPFVGDQVEFDLGRDEEDDGLIREIGERKNQFVRPPIANVDCFAVVLAAARPKPNLSIADRFLVMAEKSGTDVILCINKIDLAKGKTVSEILEIYRQIYPVVCLSGSTGEGIAELREQMSGKRTALAGPSGVGKSTILNRLIPGAGAETGDISEKTRRGKHTTRHCELFDLGGGTMIFDTPGFTSFDILEADEEELQFLYPEMEPFVGQCRYDNCRHLKEPGCAVRQAVEDGEITPCRYESYKDQLKEIQEKKKY